MKLSLKKVKWFAQDHMPSKWKNLDWTLVVLTPDNELLTTMLYDKVLQFVKEEITFSLGYKPGRLSRGGGFDRGVGFGRY